MAVSEYFSKLYRRLPVIREMKATFRLLEEIQADLRRISAKELVELLEFTVPRTSRYGDPSV